MNRKTALTKIRLAGIAGLAWGLLPVAVLVTALSSGTRVVGFGTTLVTIIAAVALAAGILAGSRAAALLMLALYLGTSIVSRSPSATVATALVKIVMLYLFFEGARATFALQRLPTDPGPAEVTL